MGLTIFHGTFPYISHIQTECGKHPEILCGISSVAHNIVMDMNNVMYVVQWKIDEVSNFIYGLTIF